MTQAIMNAAQALHAAGATVRDAELPAFSAELDVPHRVVMAAEVARTFAGVGADQRALISDSLRAFIERGERIGGDPPLPLSSATD